MFLCARKHGFWIAIKPIGFLVTRFDFYLCSLVWTSSGRKAWVTRAVDIMWRPSKLNMVLARHKVTNGINLQGDPRRLGQSCGCSSGQVLETPAVTVGWSTWSSKVWRVSLALSGFAQALPWPQKIQKKFVAVTPLYKKHFCRFYLQASSLNASLLWKKMQL
jgi:hypothetical protein